MGMEPDSNQQSKTSGMRRMRPSQALQGQVYSSTKCLCKSQESHYKDGKQEGLEILWHENEKKAAEGTYKNGKQEGLATQWHENGKKSQERTYKDGKREGLATKWHENGKKSQECTYKEIAVVLELPEGTAMSHVHRSRQFLREALGQEENEASTADSQEPRRL